MSAGPTRDFWQQRFEADETPWDRGGPGPQLLAWLDSGALRPCRIAVPGCGNGWDVVELAQRGFEVVAIDYAAAAVERTERHCRAAGVGAELVQADVTAWTPAHRVDAVYEQTCLCALHPDHWAAYAARLRDWLPPGGTLWAMFMQAQRPGASREGRIEGPPYHCDINAMRSLFTSADWDWPAPPYPSAAHARGWNELGVTLVRRP